MSLLSRSRLICAAALAAIAGCLTAVVGCGQSSSSPASQQHRELRLGYYPNLTHATAIIGVEKGFLAMALGPNLTLKTQTFNAGPAEVEAIFGGAIDAAYIGPNPVINAYVRSHGSLVRIVSGATSGGAGLVVRPGAGISDAASLKGKHLATPQLGNTQDVALRSYLAAHGMRTTVQGGGDVTITPTDNSSIVQLFKSGRIDGAWVPEPYLSTLLDNAGGKLLVDEATLWPQGQFVTAELVVTTKLLNENPEVVRGLIQGDVTATDWVNSNPQEAQQVVNSALQKLTGKPLTAKVVADAWSRLTFSEDPLAAALQRAARSAESVGLLSNIDLKGIIDVRILNDVMRSKGRAGVSSAGLGPS